MSKILTLPENIIVLKNTIEFNRPNIENIEIYNFIYNCLYEDVSDKYIDNLKKIFGISLSCKVRIIEIIRYKKKYPVFQFRLPNMVYECNSKIVQVDLYNNTSKWCIII
jgi:hypothetical protein